MTREFAKMHGLGNDFVVFDATREPLTMTPELARAVADRRLGVGCDQILVVEPPPAPDVDFGYRIYNADGSESGQCGNGARCFARFVRDRGLSDRNPLVVATIAGRMTLAIADDGQVRVDLGVPVFEPADIPFDAPRREPGYELAMDGGRELMVHALAIGNPHAVMVVDDVDSAPVSVQGPAVERHPRFPARVNVGFMAIHGPDHVALRVFERGVGETRACGSGACAAMIAGRLFHGLDETVRVDLPGGQLAVSWAGEGEPVYLTGPATHVFDGRLPMSMETAGNHGGR